MTKDKIKERVIEMLATKLFHENKIEGQEVDAQTLKYWQLQVQTILEALPIEFVSRDSEAQREDLIINKANPDGFRLRNPVQINIATILSKDKKIIQRNNKPCVYIEDIGGSDDR